MISLGWVAEADTAMHNRDAVARWSFQKRDALREFMACVRVIGIMVRGCLCYFRHH